MKLTDIKQSKLKFPLVRKLINDQIEAGVIDFKDLKSTVPKQSDLNKYGFVEDIFTTPGNIKDVFNKYVEADPNQAWNSGGWVAFGLALDKNSGQIYYPGDNFYGAKVGQVLYIHLVILGLKKLCMAQEIVRIDHQNFHIIFSYIERGMTAGIQEIRFSSINNQKTQITHSSYFKGVSSFRDLFYPYFHSMIVSKFHENVIKSLTNS
jgi:hypothetical protein